MSDVDVAVKVIASPSQKSVLLNAVELKLTWEGWPKFTISKVMLLLALDVSVTPTGWAVIAIVVVPALEKVISVGHLNVAYPLLVCIVFAAPEEKWELLNVAVALPVFAPPKVKVTFKLLAVKSRVLVVLKL